MTFQCAYGNCVPTVTDTKITRNARNIKQVPRNLKSQSDRQKQRCSNCVIESTAFLLVWCAFLLRCEQRIRMEVAQQGPIVNLCPSECEFLKDALEQGEK